MKTIVHYCTLFLVISICIPGRALGQNWADSLTSDQRFWGTSGGTARELALGAGGFGMLADTAGIKTVGVNPYSLDPQFMLMNPAYAARYKSYLWFDAGLTSTDVGQDYGGTFALSEHVTGGLILARSDAVGFSLINPNLFGQMTSAFSGMKIAPPANTWQVMGAYAADGLDVGLAFSYMSSTASSTAQSPSDTSSRSATVHQIGISGGALYRGDDGMLMDLGATVLLPLARSSVQNGTVSMTAIAINARMFIPIQPEFYLVPIVNAYVNSGKSTILATPKDLPSGSNYDVGIGVNFWRGGVHVTSGVSMGIYSQTQPALANFSPSLTSSQFVFPRWNIGAEWPALKWLRLRLGYFASSGSGKQEFKLNASTAASRSQGFANVYSPFYAGSGNASGLTVGAGFDLGHFNIDATVTTSALHSPLSIFQTGPLSFVTMSYRFE